MPPDQFDRRRVLTFGAATAMGFWAGFGASTTAATGRQPDAEATLLKFAVTIPGLPEASKGVRAFALDELRLLGRENDFWRRDSETWGRDNDYWSLKPGDVDPGSATFTIAGNPRIFQEVKAWFTEAAAGKGIRKSITVTLSKPETKGDSGGRTYILTDCFPTSWSAVNFDTSSTVQTETLTVKVGRIEFKT